MDGRIQAVNTSTANIKETRVKIYDSMDKFRQVMIQNEEKQLALRLSDRLTGIFLNMKS